MVFGRNENWSRATDPFRPAYPDKIVVKVCLDPLVNDQRMIQNARGAVRFAVVMDTAVSPQDLDLRWHARPMRCRHPGGPRARRPPFGCSPRVG
jgi:hypothetical protein